jgi:seryl-tRNA synthetase
MPETRWYQPVARGLETKIGEKAHFQTLEAERKTLQTRTQELQAQPQQLSKQIGMLKGKGEDASA